MKTYGQFCPVAMASELFAQRWTPLIIRELLSGSTHFNDLHRGIPLISRALFAQRLKGLVDAGLVERKRQEYRLTRSGQELAPAVDALGVWGQHWMREIRRENVNVDLLMWNVHRRIHRDRLPPGRTVVLFEFSEVPPAKRNFWLVLHRDEVDICLKDPGFDVSLTVETSPRALAEIWRGLASIPQVIRDGRLRLDGPRELRRAFPDWLMLSRFAGR